MTIEEAMKKLEEIIDKNIKVFLELKNQDKKKLVRIRSDFLKKERSF